MVGLRRVLALPAAYSAFQALIGGRSRERYVREYLHPAPGMRVFDIGCGPGEFAALLGPVEYTGLDLSPAYVAAARARYDGRAEFRCGDVTSADITGDGTFDLVTANGLLHHLPDAAVRQTLELAARLLRPGGRFVSIDPAFAPGQPWVARWLARRDRGEFVRPAAEYERLARWVFPAVVPVVRHDLLRVPYTHVILDCTTGAGG